MFRISEITNRSRNKRNPHSWDRITEFSGKKYTKVVVACVERGDTDGKNGGVRKIVWIALEHRILALQNLRTGEIRALASGGPRRNDISEIRSCTRSRTCIRISSFGNSVSSG
jgi:hypothetical protein